MNVLRPLIERIDYGVMDQLEHQFVHLPKKDRQLVKDQFKNRIKDEDIINEVLASYE